MSKQKELLTARETAAFCSQLAYIVKAGVPIREGISIMAEDAEDESARAILSDIAEQLDSGAPLAEAIEHCGAFPDYLIKMVEIGHTSGKLEEVLDSLAAYYENSDSITRGIQNAVAYPLAMILMMAVVIAVLVLRVLPVFRDVLEQLGGEAGGLSSSAMSVGTVLGNVSLVAIGIIVLAAAVMLIMRSTVNGRAALAKLLSKIVFTRAIVRKTAESRFASTMALMLSSGLDVDRSLEMAMGLIDDDETRRRMEQMKTSIDSGVSFSDALSKSALLSGLDARMVSVGFLTGTLDAVMKKIADRAEDEIGERIGNMISIIEPTLVAVLSIVVGAIILSVMLPLMSIMSALV